MLVFPDLEVRSAAYSTRIYTDSGTGADWDLSVFEPYLFLDGRRFYMLGHTAQRNHNLEADDVVTIVRSDDPDAIAAPLYLLQTWTDRGSGGDQDVAFWHVYCPDGYTALGDVISADTFDNPYNDIKNKYACIRKDLVNSSSIGNVVWNDKGSGAVEDGSLWSVSCNRGTPSYFQSINGFDAPSSARAYCLICNMSE